MEIGRPIDSYLQTKIGAIPAVEDNSITIKTCENFCCFFPSFHCFALFAAMSQPEKTYKSCQSCGIPMDKSAGPGTEADGSLSPMYCSYCYKNGAFVQPGWTAADMQAYASKKLQQYGLPAFLCDMLTKGIPKLERWQQEPGSSQ